MAIELTREELYERVWAESMQKLSKQFGLSDVGLAKTCRRWDIPVPPRGYWAKLQAGKRVKKVPLPPDTANEFTSKLSFADRTKTPTTPPKAPPPPPPLIAAEAESANAIVVSEDLQIRHPLLKPTRESWRLMDSQGYQWNTPLPPHFNIAVDKASRPRALRLLETLFRALEARGHAVKIGDHNKLLAAVLGETFEILLRERQRQIRRAKARNTEKRASFESNRPYDLVHSGEFELRIERRFGRDTFRDKTGWPLEKQLNQVVAALLRAAFAEKDHRAAAEKARLAQIERDRRRAIEEERQRQEKDRIRRFLKWFKASQRHKRLRAFVSELKEAIGDVDGSSELGRWLESIEEYVDDNDVLCRIKDRQSTITLYHCVSTYLADRIVADGFGDHRSGYGENSELPAAVTVTDVPMEGVHGGTVCIVVDVPEDVALPYEDLVVDRQYRQFRIPADVINRYARRVSTDDGND